MTERNDAFMEELRAYADDPEQAELVSFHLAVRRVQLDAQAQIPPRPAAIEPGADFLNGVPLLPVDRLRLEPGLFVQTLDRVAGLVAERRPQWAVAADVPYLALVSEWYRRGVLPDRTLSLVLQMTLRPFLEREAQDILHAPGAQPGSPAPAGLAPQVDLSAWWRGWCPLCGGLPSFAALTPPGGERVLLCPRCLTQWSFSRVVCPFCGEADAARLGYYPSADNVYRLYVCESCKGYLKTVDYREVSQQAGLPVLDVLTTDMDIAAVSNGYQERGGQLAYWARAR